MKQKPNQQKTFKPVHVHPDGDIYVLQNETYEYVGFLDHEGTLAERIQGLERLINALET